MTKVRIVRKKPTRGRAASHGPRLSWRSKLIIGSVVLVLCLLGLGEVARLLAPTANTSRQRFDAIIVLGYPADSDGNPTPEQLARVTEGVHEYERGVAPRLIVTGGAAHNHYTEAQVMARSAEALGIPKSAIFMEPEARDTIQNACYSVRIMRAHGWRSAEVISRASHLPRAGIIFSKLPIEWRTHAAPPLEPESAAYQWGAATVEVVKTMRYLVWAQWTESCAP